MEMAQKSKKQEKFVKYENSQEELDRFKRDRDLLKTVLFQHFGELEKSPKYTVNNPIYKTASGSVRIFTSRKGDELCVFGGKTGSVLDFVRDTEGLNIGQVRKKLRDLQRSSGYVETQSQTKNEKQHEPCPAKQKFYLEKYCRRITEECPSKYLLSRGISAETQEFFASHGAGIFEDLRWKNTIFLLYNKKGVCGLEKRNFSFKGLNQGSIKGLWFAGNTKNPEKIVFTESSIDAMSLHQLAAIKGGDDKNDKLYISISGEMNDEQKVNIQATINKYLDAQILAGFDNDKQGDTFAAFLKDKAAGRGFKRLVSENKDWNDDLCKVLGIGQEVEAPSP